MDKLIYTQDGSIVLLFTIIMVAVGVYVIYTSTIAEYTKIFRPHTKEYECICIGLDSNGSTSREIWRYAYNGEIRTYSPGIYTSFGLAKIGDKSRIGINTKKDKVVYVKKSLKNKILYLIFGAVLVIIGLVLSITLGLPVLD